MISNPKKLFLIDGIGALVSAFSLGIILTTFQSYFGMPKNTLYILAFIPCLFAVYDLVCYFQVKQNWRPFLKIIAFANLIYCVISIGFLFNHYQQLTILGWIYFIVEVIIIVVLVKIEFDIANGK